MASPAYIGKSTQASGNAATLDVDFMSGISAGDILFLAINSYQLPGGSIGDITTPSGWTFLNGATAYRNLSFGNVGTFKVFYKVASGSETGHVTVTRTGSNGGSNKIHGQMYQFRGSNPLIGGAAANGLGDGDSTIVWNAVSTFGPENTLLAFACQISASPDAPSGYTDDGLDSSVGGTATYLRLSHKLNASTGGSVNSVSGDPAGWCTVHASMFNADGRRFQIIN